MLTCGIAAAALSLPAPPAISQGGTRGEVAPASTTYPLRHRSPACRRPRDCAGPPPGPVTGPVTPAPPGRGIPAWSTPGCAVLGPPAGPVIDVTPSDAAQLADIVRSAAPGTTIRLADGTYPVTGDYSHSLVLARPGLTIRGASGDPTRVVLDGQYAIGAIVYALAADVTITDVTLRRATDHLVHSYPPATGPDVVGVRLHRLRLLDAGEQFVKVNSNVARSHFVDSGALTCSELTMTAAGRQNIERAYGCYTGGIDAHMARGWVVRSNTFTGIYCEDGEVAEHAVHFWVGSRDTLVENNYMRDIARGVGFGLVEAGETRSYPDNPYPGLFVGHFGGTIRNNVIVATIPQYDTGIELDQARGSTIVHNTVLEAQTATNSFSSIDYRFPNTSATIRNNLVRRITVRNGATATLGANVENVPAGWFADAAGGDVHLRDVAVGAIGQALALPPGGAGHDIDGTRRDVVPLDIGADER